jgi:hypothetical protein
MHNNFNFKKKTLPYQKKENFIDGHSIFFSFLVWKCFMNHNVSIYGHWKSEKYINQCILILYNRHLIIGSKLFCHYTSITPKHGIHDWFTSTWLVTYIFSHHLCHVYSHNLIIDAMFWCIEESGHVFSWPIIVIGPHVTFISSYI